MGTWNGQNRSWGVIVINGRNGFCLDSGMTPPDSLNDSTPKKICGGTNSSGDPDATAQMAYLTGKHANTTDDHTATSVSDFNRAQYRAGMPITYPSVYNALVAEAKRNAGKHDAYITVDADNLAV